MKNWKTTLLGWALGAIPLIDGLIKAYELGAFNGVTTSQALLGVATIALGVWAKDPKK